MDRFLKDAVCGYGRARHGPTMRVHATAVKTRTTNGCSACHTHLLVLWLWLSTRWRCGGCPTTPGRPGHRCPHHTCAAHAVGSPSHRGLREKNESIRGFQERRRRRHGKFREAMRPSPGAGPAAAPAARARCCAARAPRRRARAARARRDARGPSPQCSRWAARAVMGRLPRSDS